MKLRIKGNSVRLRLTQKEVLQLRDTLHISDGIDFLNTPFRYGIFASEDCEQVSTRFENGQLGITVPKQLIVAWANSDLVGFEGIQAEGDQKIRLLIEKDFACLKPREGEDDSDAFPHPEEQTSMC